jgi:hypothetical protein
MTEASETLQFRCWHKADALGAPESRFLSLSRHRMCSEIRRRSVRSAVEYSGVVYPPDRRQAQREAQETAFLAYVRGLTIKEREELYEELSQLTSSRKPPGGTVLPMPPPSEPRPEV